MTASRAGRRTGSGSLSTRIGAGVMKFGSLMRTARGCNNSHSHLARRPFTRSGRRAAAALFSSSATVCPSSSKRVSHGTSRLPDNSPRPPRGGSSSGPGRGRRTDVSWPAGWLMRRTARTTFTPTISRRRATSSLRHLAVTPSGCATTGVCCSTPRAAFISWTARRRKSAKFTPPRPTRRRPPVSRVTKVLFITRSCEPKRTSGY